jgi:hypothetical protein
MRRTEWRIGFVFGVCVFRRRLYRWICRRAVYFSPSMAPLIAYEEALSSQQSTLRQYGAGLDTHIHNGGKEVRAAQILKLLDASRVAPIYRLSGAHVTVYANAHPLESYDELSLSSQRSSDSA